MNRGRSVFTSCYSCCTDSNLTPACVSTASQHPKVIEGFSAPLCAILCVSILLSGLSVCVCVFSVRVMVCVGGSLLGCGAVCTGGGGG